MAKHGGYTPKHAPGRHAANPKASGAHATGKHEDSATSRASGVTDAGKLVQHGYDPNAPR